jgi:CheY-like chemotaxis protein
MTTRRCARCSPSSSISTTAFTTIQVSTAAEGLEKAKLAHYDAILLDIGLPDMDGRELCKLMRREGVRAPIIMLTAADSDADTILGLESGANDYVTKPFRINVLLARLRAHLRQHERSEDAVMSIGPYEFHPAGKLLLEKGGKKKVRLTDKEASILKYLFPCRRPAGRPGHPAERGLGLQRRRHDAYPGNPHLPPAPEDRKGSGQRRDPGDRPGGLPAPALRDLPIRDLGVIFSVTTSQNHPGRVMP